MGVAQPTQSAPTAQPIQPAQPAQPIQPVAPLDPNNFFTSTNPGPSSMTVWLFFGVIALALVGYFYVRVASIDAHSGNHNRRDSNDNYD